MSPTEAAAAGYEAPPEYDAAPGPDEGQVLKDLADRVTRLEALVLHPGDESAQAAHIAEASADSPAEDAAEASADPAAVDAQDDDETPG